MHVFCLNGKLFRTLRVKMVHQELLSICGKYLNKQQLAALINYPERHPRDPLLSRSASGGRRCPCGVSHTQTLLSFHSLVAFILHELTLPTTPPDAVLQYLSLAAQALRYASSINDALLENDRTILATLADRLAGLPLPHDQIGVKELWNDFLVELFVLFPVRMEQFTANPQITLQDRLEVASRFLRNYPTLPCQESIKVLLEQLLAESGCELTGKLSFLVAVAESQQRDDLSALISSQFAAVDSLLQQSINTTDALVFNSALLFLDKYMNYSGEMYRLTAKVETLDSVATWVLRQFFILTSPKCIELAKQMALVTVSSCACVEIRKIVSVVLKSLCIGVRNLGKRELETELLGLRSMCLEHASLPLPRLLCSVFARDDEGLCESLLCLLHLHLLLPGAAGIPTPESCFAGLLDVISDDHFVLISWITDNQNCFLPYFAQYVKYAEGKGIGRRQENVLERLVNSLDKLVQDGKIPFNIQPLTRRLRMVLKQPETALAK